MTRGERITGVRFERLRISPITVWMFVLLESADGRTGVGEATVPRGQEAVAAAAERKLAAVVGHPAGPEACAALAADESLIAEAALVSAVDAACLDLEGQARSLPAHALLGEALRDCVELYANINRRTIDRTPDGFAASAAAARDRGFTTVKIAPFDEITVETCDAPDVDGRLATGLARIAATRAQLGRDALLRVDCHWRFTPAAAERMIDACAPFELDWIECPIPERAATVEAVVALRRRANRYGMRLAGLEKGTGLASFRPFLEAGAYDVIMPDVKYLGPLSRFRELATLAARYGGVVSPHNPSGPVSHAASLHVAATVPEIDSLEHQFDETPLFDALVGGPVSAVRDGTAGIPDAPGLGVRLDMALVERLRLHPADTVPCDGDEVPGA